MTEPTEIEIDGFRYRLRRWDFVDARRWLHRLGQLLIGAGAQVAARDEMQIAVGELVGGIETKDFEALWAMCEKYTDLVGTSGSQGTPTELSKVAGEHMRGRLFTMVALMKAHIVQEFVPFFGRLSELFPSAPAEKGK